MKNISVIGAGTMGNGIAHVLATAGYNVSMIDISEEVLKKAMTTIEKNIARQVDKGHINSDLSKKAFQSISTTSNLNEGIQHADLVIEAATENIDTKLSLFAKLDQVAPSHAILATNTSSISITKIGSVTDRAEKVIGMHFMNPVPMMKLVEVIRGYKTNEQTTKDVVALARALRKTPVEVKDYPGFVANRILMPMINEAIYALHEGVSNVEAIDEVMKLGMRHPMGPLQLADFIGLDVCLSIMNVLYEGFRNPKYAPCPLLVNMVAAGHKGVKTGVGFYNYTKHNPEQKVADFFKK